MDEILKYLSLKYGGDWMAMYDSLQQRERVTIDDISRLCSKLDTKCEYITLLDENYIENFKSIYKPPFGIYYKGNYDLLKDEDIVTVYADPIKSKEDILQLSEDKVVTLWPNLSEEEYKQVITLKPENNVFVQEQLKDTKIVGDDKNLVMSEIFEKDRTRDYSKQAEERITMGSTKKVMILKQPTNKETMSIYQYSMNEDIKIYAKEELKQANPDVKLFKNAQTLNSDLSLPRDRGMSL